MYAYMCPTTTRPTTSTMAPGGARTAEWRRERRLRECRDFDTRSPPAAPVEDRGGEVPCAYYITTLAL
jgi:hypothetical protein